MEHINGAPGVTAHTDRRSCLMCPVASHSLTRSLACSMPSPVASMPIAHMLTVLVWMDAHVLPATSSAGRIDRSHDSRGG